jgi:hypothetical protein
LSDSWAVLRRVGRCKAPNVRRERFNLECSKSDPFTMIADTVHEASRWGIQWGPVGFGEHIDGKTLTHCHGEKNAA